MVIIEDYETCLSVIKLVLILSCGRSHIANYMQCMFTNNCHAFHSVIKYKKFSKCDACSLKSIGNSMDTKWCHSIGMKSLVLTVSLVLLSAQRIVFQVYTHLHNVISLRDHPIFCTEFTILIVIGICQVMISQIEPISCQ